MNRVCIHKETNGLIEFQSGNAPLGTLTQNAINSGYEEGEIEEFYTELSAEQAIATYESPEQEAAREASEAKKELAQLANEMALEAAHAAMEEDGQGPQETNTRKKMFKMVRQLTMELEAEGENAQAIMTKMYEILRDQAKAELGL